MARCRCISLDQRDVLFHQTDAISHVHFLLYGVIKRSTVLYDHAGKVLEIIHGGQAIALGEVLNAKNYQSTAMAIQPSEVLAIPLDDLLAAARADTTLCFRLLEALARQNHASEFETITHHALPANQRVLDYLLRLAGDARNIAGETTVQLDASKRVIASRLDMTPETFSRTLNQLGKDGVIVVNGRRVHIQNAPLVVERRLAGDDSANVPRYGRQERLSIKTTSPASLINLCGRLRMLSQRMATAWVMQARGITSAAARVALRKFRTRFESILDELGGAALPESVQPHMNAIQAAWPEYRDQLNKNSSSAKGDALVFDLSERMLEIADRLTGAVTLATHNPDAQCVNKAGRNRMLSARVLKLHLFRTWNIRRAEADRLIRAARVEFDSNIAELRQRAAGLPEALAQLELDITHWEHLLGMIEASPQPAQFPQSQISILSTIEAGESLLRHADTTVKLYELIFERANHPAD